VIAAVVVGLSGFVFLDREYRARAVQLAVARDLMRRQAWGEALARLEALGSRRLAWGWADGEVDYRIGLCRWRLGRREDAVAAWRRVAAGSPYAAEAAVMLAEDQLIQGQLAAAEDRLLALLRPGEPGPKPVMMLLVRLARVEARYDEARAWMRAAFDRADEPIALLRQLWLLDRGVVPILGVRANLDQWLARSPEDDRVWLGLARVATLEGRFDEAEAWLGRCARRRPDDRAVDRARRDWARAAGRAEALEAVLAGPLGAQLEPAQRLDDRAWLAQQAGRPEEERRALECWLEREPHDPFVLERLGTLAAQAGDVAHAAELRNRKRRVDEALRQYGRRIQAPDRFDGLADRLAMTRLAVDAGRTFDARAWCALARRLEPSNPDAAAILAGLDRAAVAPGCDGDRGGDPTRHPRPPARPVDGAAATGRARVEFRDEAHAAGLRFRYDPGETPLRQIPEVMGGGVGLLDYDGDGWLDVYCIQGGPFPPDPSRPPGGDRLFRNRRDGTFEDVTDSAGLSALPLGYGHGGAVGDYDNDGRPDLFLTRWRRYVLYRNRGDGTFEDATDRAGLGGDRDWPTSAAFADLDGDGDLDLYVCHYLRWDPAQPKICRDPETGAYSSCSPLQFAALPDHVFRNEGGRFADVTAAAGIVDAGGRGLGVVAADLDGDGRIDLFVTNDQTANFLFRNLGGFRFEEVGHIAGVAGNASGGYQAGMGVACGDVDGDGRPDLAVTNFYGESTTLYRNLGSGLFADSTAASGLAIPSRHLLGFGAAFLDVDDDGRLDLLTANGHLDRLPGTPYAMPMQLLLGDGGRLRDVTATAGPALTVPRIARGLAVGDLDNDGRLDALVVDHAGPLGYLHNRATGGGHFVVLRLEGTGSARDAVGARVRVTAGGRTQVAWRIGGGSYQSASDGRLHFGLGTAARIESIEVQWPAGRLQRFVDLVADRGYGLREGRAEPSPLPGFGR
jgi:tetratricopeptide (TPR) repeat protein